MLNSFIIYALLNKSLNMFFEKIDWLIPYEYITDKSEIVPGCRIRSFTTSKGRFVWKDIKVMCIDGDSIYFKFSEMYMIDDNNVDNPLNYERIITCNIDEFEIV